MSRIILIGSPNSGKSLLFNRLTGLSQKVANFPGVTVEQMAGKLKLKDTAGNDLQAEVIDLPGTYSLYPKSPEEELPFRLLCNPDHPLHPDVTIVIADGTNLKRNLFLCSQVRDLNIPVVLVINMMDLVRYKQTEIDFAKLEESMGVRIVPMNARKNALVSFFAPLGKNPLAVYLVSEILLVTFYLIPIQDTRLWPWLYETLYQPLGNDFGSLLMALSFMLLCWSVGFWMDRKKIYWRV